MMNPTWFALFIAIMGLACLAAACSRHAIRDARIILICWSVALFAGAGMVVSVGGF